MSPTDSIFKQKKNTSFFEKKWPKTKDASRSFAFELGQKSPGGNNGIEILVPKKLEEDKPEKLESIPAEKPLDDDDEPLPESDEKSKPSPIKTDDEPCLPP
jgi:hypothetical protein